LHVNVDEIDTRSVITDPGAVSQKSVAHKGVRKKCREGLLNIVFNAILLIVH